MTVNEGRSWSTWDVAAHLPGKAFYNTSLIEAVSMTPDGAGTMTLSSTGASTYTGTTTVNNGVLQISAGGGFGYLALAGLLAYRTCNGQGKLAEWSGHRGRQC